jgi:bleomycin hydrolase
MRIWSRYVEIPSYFAKGPRSLTQKDATFALARLVLTQKDPLSSLQSRGAVIADEKIFNIDLKGIDEKESGKYPGPVTNQASSGRCWLFATSELSRSVTMVLS